MQRLPIAQAATRLGVSKTALRRRVERRTVDAIKGDNGEWLVAVPDADDQVVTPTGGHRDTPSDTPAVEALSTQLTFLQAQLIEKDRQISELHIMLQTAQRQLPASVPMTGESPLRRDDHQPSGAHDQTPQRGVQREPEASWRVRLRRWLGR